MMGHMERAQVERLLNMLDDLSEDERAALLYSLDADYLFFKAARDRVQFAIKQALDEDGALEVVTDNWLVELTNTGNPKYDYNVDILDQELKPLIPEGDYEELFKVIPEKREVKRIVANNLAKKRGTKVKEVLDRACTTIPPGRSVQVKPL